MIAWQVLQCNSMKLGPKGEEQEAGRRSAQGQKQDIGRRKGGAGHRTASGQGRALEGTGARAAAQPDSLEHVQQADLPPAASLPEAQHLQQAHPHAHPHLL